MDLRCWIFNASGKENTKTKQVFLPSFLLFFPPSQTSELHLLTQNLLTRGSSVTSMLWSHPHVHPHLSSLRWCPSLSFSSRLWHRLRTHRLMASEPRGHRRWASMSVRVPVSTAAQCRRHAACWLLLSLTSASRDVQSRMGQLMGLIFIW